MPQNVKSPAQLGDRAFRIAPLGGFEHSKATSPTSLEQAAELARNNEALSRRAAAGAGLTAGVAGQQRLALAHHYGRLAMEGAR